MITKGIAMICITDECPKKLNIAIQNTEAIAPKLLPAIRCFPYLTVFSWSSRNVKTAVIVDTTYVSRFKRKLIKIHRNTLMPVFTFLKPKVNPNNFNHAILSKQFQRNRLYHIGSTHILDFQKNEQRFFHRALRGKFYQ